MSALVIAVFVPYFWVAMHMMAWEDQERAFVAAHTAGDHALSIDIYEEQVDVAWTPLNLRLANKWSDENFMQSADSYARLGRAEDAERQYLKVLGWTRQQYDAYCALNPSCDAESLATIRSYEP